MNKPFYFLALGLGIYTALFYSANNIDLIDGGTVVMSLMTISLFTLIIMAILSLAYNFFLTKKIKKKHSILVGALFVLFSYYMRLPIQDALQLYLEKPLEKASLVGLQLILSTGAFFFGYLVSVLKAQKKILAIFSLISLFPTYKLIDRFIIGDREIAEESTGPSPIFKKRKNVYFILFDGYGSIDALNMLGIKNADFLENLSQKGFRLYKSFFTNLQPTINAMPTFFHMDFKYNEEFINNRKVISFLEKSSISTKKGKVYKIFKDNDYRINIVHHKKHIILHHCQADICFPTHVPLSSYFKIFDKVILMDKFQLFFNPLSARMRHQRHGGFRSTVFSSISSERSQFSYFHFFSPNHTAGALSGVCDEEEEIKKYAKRVDGANADILEIIRVIESQDPDSLVILTSDHGAFIANKCGFPKKAPKTAKEVLDGQGAFLAIKWGKDYDGKFDKDIKSSSNLFRYIFSHLAQDDSILSTKVPDDAYYKRKKTIDDGNLVFQ